MNIAWPCIYDAPARAGMALTVTYPEERGPEGAGVIWHVKPREDGEQFCGLALQDYEAGEAGEFTVAMRPGS